MTEQNEAAPVDELPDDVAEADDVEPDDQAPGEDFPDSAQQDDEADGIGPIGDTAPPADAENEGTGEDG